MDLYLEVDPNPNCDAAEGMMYCALEPARPLARLWMIRDGQPECCWVTGVESPGVWVPAVAQKITDSGAGVVYAIYGGRWGIRFQPSAEHPRPWDLADRTQWGEPYKIYGALNDLVFAA